VLLQDTRQDKADDAPNRHCGKNKHAPGIGAVVPRLSDFRNC
jgi:hypothetical protein